MIRPRSSMDGRYGERDLDHAAILPPSLRLELLDAFAPADAIEDLAHLAGVVSVTR